MSNTRRHELDTASHASPRITLNRLIPAASIDSPTPVTILTRSAANRFGVADHSTTRSATHTRYQPLLRNRTAHGPEQPRPATVERERLERDRYARGATLRGWGGGTGWGQVKSMVSTCCLCVVRCALPRDWLQCRQMTRPFSTVFSPPRLWGMMWSGSALFGLRACS